MLSLPCTIETDDTYDIHTNKYTCVCVYNTHYYRVRFNPRQFQSLIAWGQDLRKAGGIEMGETLIRFVGVGHLEYRVWRRRLEIARQFQSLQYRGGEMLKRPCTIETEI